MKIHFFDKTTGACVKALVLSHNPSASDLPKEIVKAFPDWKNLNLFVVAVDPDARDKSHSIILEDDSICIVPERTESSMFGLGWNAALQEAHREYAHNTQNANSVAAPLGAMRNSWYGRGTPEQVADTSAIVTCHNYGHYLQDCVHSLLNAQVMPREVLIIHDRCETCDLSETPKSDRIEIRTIKTDFGNSAMTRNYGADQSTGKFLLFDDADDTYSADFIATLCRPFADSRVVMAYPSLQWFGSREGGMILREFNRHELLEQNYMPISCLVRADAFRAVGGFDTELEMYRDWDLWIRITRGNGLAAPCPEAIQYHRVHETNMMHDAKHEHYDAVVNKNANILIASAFDGKVECVEEHCASIGKFDFNPNQLHLLAIDNSFNKKISTLLRRKASAFAKTFASVRYLNRSDLLPIDRNTEKYSEHISQRMVDLYGSIPFETDCEFVLVFENDVIAPPDTITRLLSLMHPSVGAVSAIVNAKPAGKKKRGIQAWNYTNLNPPQIDFESRITIDGKEPIRIGTSAFSCLLIRTGAWRQIRLRAARPIRAYDGIFGYDLDQVGYKYFLDPSVKCKHMIGGGKYV